MNITPCAMERRLDCQNRIVIPAEFRSALNWPSGVSVFMEYQPDCAEIVVVAEKKLATKTFSTCRIRKLDQLGRLCLPAEFRKVFRLSEGSPLRIECNLGAREVRLMMPA